MVNVYKCCYKVLKKQYKTLITYKKQVLKDKDIEDIHQMRVVIRRVRSVIKSFNTFIDPEIKLLVKQDLKCLAKKLGSVRDLDVSIVYLSKYLVKYPDNKGIKYLLKSFSEKRREYYIELKRFLRSKEYKKIKNNLKILVSNMHEKSLTGDGSEHYSIYYKSLEKIIDQVYSYKKVENLNKSDKDLHMLRIAIKNLRYNMEFLNLKDSNARKYVKYFKKMQENLGFINDCDFINSKLSFVLNDESIKEKYASGIKELIKYNDDLKELKKTKIVLPWDELDIESIKNIYKP